MLRNRGYPFAAVYRSYGVDRTARTARVEYAVDLGPRARIGAIVVEGQQRVHEPTVRRQLVVKEGDVYRQDALFESQRHAFVVVIGDVEEAHRGLSDGEDAALHR